MKVKSDHSENLTKVLGGAKNGQFNLNPRFVNENCLKLISFDLIVIQKVVFMVRDLPNNMSHASFEFHFRRKNIPYNIFNNYKYFKTPKIRQKRRN